MKTYKVRAERWARGWELHIDGVGVTQSHSLRDAEGMARDYIALDADVSPESFVVEILPEVGHGLDEKTRAARKAVADAGRAQRAGLGDRRLASQGGQDGVGFSGDPAD
jgi:hypothetical protein